MAQGWGAAVEAEEGGEPLKTVSFNAYKDALG